jgi:haloacid dehalogenase-like hydrolase
MRQFRAAVFLVLCVITSNARAADDPLPSWNDGPTKTAILQFVQATTDQSNPKFVAPEERVATFDQDGTLWLEHPMYTQVVYCLERVPAVVAKKPELKNVEPFKTVLSDNREAMAKLPQRDLEKILAATLTGMTVDEFQAEAKKWLATARHPRWQRSYSELVYQPMLEVLKLLRANGYKTYIVTGGGQDSCASIPSKYMGSRRSKWSGQRAGPSSASTRRAGRS